MVKKVEKIGKRVTIEEFITKEERIVEDLKDGIRDLLAGKSYTKRQKFLDGLKDRLENYSRLKNVDIVIRDIKVKHH